MKRRQITIALSIFGCLIIAVILLLAADGMLAVNRLNPVSTAEAAVVNAGWEVNSSHLRSVEATGGLFGSSAIVKYRIGDVEGSELRTVHLRRPLFTRHWKVVKIESN